MNMVWHAYIQGPNMWCFTSYLHSFSLFLKAIKMDPAMELSLVASFNRAYTPKNEDSRYKIRLPLSLCIAAPSAQKNGRSGRMYTGYVAAVSNDNCKSKNERCIILFSD